MTVAGVAPSATRPAAALASAKTFRFPISDWRPTGFGFGDEWLASCGGLPKRHNGVDIAADAGDPVRATANGKIIGVYFERPWGYTILVEHSVPGEGTVISRYGHVRANSGYRPGRAVEKGERIAAVYDLGGNTHFAFGIHVGAYDRFAWRGALPRKSCGGDPAFPHRFVDPTRYVRVHSDLTPPRTTASAAATVRARSGWTRGKWVVTFRCRDDVAGCARTQYVLNGGTVKTASGRVRVETEGRHVLKYRSIDARGNVESWRRKVLGIDRTAPLVEMSTTEPAVFRRGDQVWLGAEASDPSAGAPAGASRTRRVRFYFCPVPAAAGDCAAAFGVLDRGVWIGRSPQPLPRGLYQGWARAEDFAGNADDSGAVAFAVAGVD